MRTCSRDIDQKRETPDMSDEENNNRTLLEPDRYSARRYYFSVGFHWSNGHQIINGVKHIASDKPVLTASEAVGMATQGTGLWSPTMTSFAAISREQYDCFEQEKVEREQARQQQSHPSIGSSSSICSVQ